MLNTE